MAERGGDLELERRLERTMLRLLAERSPSVTICPSEVSRAVGGDDWRPLMEPTRAVARRLMRDGVVEITQRGAVIDPDTIVGPIRIRRAGQFHADPTDPLTPPTPLTDQDRPGA
jgi:hypothetical protein